MRTFESNKEFFEAVNDLAAQLDSVGQATAAREIRDGMSCINGLTDGWAGFHDAVEAVQRRIGRQLSAADQADLRAICKAARGAVYLR